MKCDNCKEDKPDVKGRWIATTGDYDDDIYIPLCDKCYSDEMDDL